METNISQQCTNCVFFNTMHMGCNYEDFMRQNGVRKTHFVNYEGDCRGYTKKEQD